MKVYIKAPWDTERHGPYEAILRDDDDWSVDIGQSCEIVQERYIFPAEPAYPPVGIIMMFNVGEPTVTDGVRRYGRHGGDGRFRIGNTVYHATEWYYPEPPWESAPDDACYHIWLSDGTTRWWVPFVRLGTQETSGHRGMTYPED